jgi:hypothetical protein
MDSMIQSDIFWLACRVILTGTNLSALQYNKLVYLVSESYSAEFNEIPMEVPYVLLGLPVAITHPELYSMLSKLIEKILSDGLLTGSQRALVQTVGRKLKDSISIVSVTID